MKSHATDELCRKSALGSGKHQGHRITASCESAGTRKHSARCVRIPTGPGGLACVIGSWISSRKGYGVMQHAYWAVVLLLAGCTPSDSENDRQRDWLSRSFLGAAVLSDTGHPIGRVDTVFLAPDGTVVAISVAGTARRTAPNVPLDEVRLFSDPGVGSWFKREAGPSKTTPSDSTCSDRLASVR